MQPGKCTNFANVILTIYFALILVYYFPKSQKKLNWKLVAVFRMELFKFEKYKWKNWEKLKVDQPLSEIYLRLGYR